MNAKVCNTCGGQEAITETGSFLGGNDLGLAIEGTIEKCALCRLIEISAEDFIAMLSN